MSQKNRVLYMAVTADELELPLCVFDSIQELANWAEKPYRKIYKAIQEHLLDIDNNCFYIKTKVPQKSQINIKITVYF